MMVRPLGIEGAFEFTPVRHDDRRGSYLESYRSDVVAKAVGHPLRLEQWNTAVSNAGALRGIHFAEAPPGQAKYVTCVRGSGLDVVVDLRIGSPTFGEFDAVELDDVDRRAVYLAEGLGHAFLARTDDTVLSYLCSAPYRPSREHAIFPLDPALGIPWAAEPVLSAKDAGAPTLEQAAALGVLPAYGDCLRLYRQLDEGSGEPFDALR